MGKCNLENMCFEILIEFIRKAWGSNGFVCTRNKLIPINIVRCSPLKADFIRAKYQMLAFVNKQKDVDLSSPEDLSQVRYSLVQ